MKDEQMQQAWAGMLAASCLAETDESSSRSYMNLLTQLLPAHIQMLASACKRAMQIGWEPGFVFRQNMYCPANEIRRLTGVRDIAGVEQDLNHLHQLELLQPTIRANALEHIVDANITPTGLGLKLFARCCGRTEPPETLDVNALEMAPWLEMAS